jgi:DNA-binding transcriptional LysR family regulator
MVVGPVLPGFTQSYPEIVVEILIDPALTNIVAQRLDAGIRLGESLEKDVVAVRVTGPLRMAVVGTPHYFASHPAPVTPHDLRKHRCINFRLSSAGTISITQVGARYPLHSRRSSKRSGCRLRDRRVG